MIYLAWIAWAAAGVFAVAVFRRGTEEEGATGRRLGTIAVFAIATLVIFFAGATPKGLPVGTLFGWNAPAEENIARLNARKAELERQRAEVEAQLNQERLQAASRLPEPVNGSQAIFVEVSPERQAIVLTALFLLLAIDVTLLLVSIGVISLPGPFRDAGRAAQKLRLGELAQKVWDADYRAALVKAADIRELKLEKSDQLEFFYLRSYAALQVYSYPAEGETADYRQKLLDGVVADLTEVVSAAPKNAMAQYTLGLALGFAGKYDEALECFDKSRQALASLSLPFSHNESVCLLYKAEGLLGRGDVEAAQICFDRVIALGSLRDAVLPVRLNIAMSDLSKAVRRKAAGAALDILSNIARLPGFDEKQSAALEVMRIGLSTRAALVEGNTAAAVAEAEQFAERYMPSGLPPVDYDTAEDVFSPVEDADLAFPRNVYRGILFILALGRAMAEKPGRVSQTAFERMADPLLRGLQLDPRNRDLLAALGGLCYWTQRDMRARARQWIEAAVVMGLVSHHARAILMQDQAVEERRRDLLGVFRSASARFLRDPTLAAETRRALVNELGRFQEFEPLLIDLRARPDYEHEEPTVAALRDRARYLSGLLEDVLRRGEMARFERLANLKEEYSGNLRTLEQTMDAIKTLEHTAIVELSSSLAMI
ncbi:MAG: tetratricopeptide repeat protein [Rhizomicrobium sp.]